MQYRTTKFEREINENASPILKIIFETGRYFSPNKTLTNNSGNNNKTNKAETHKNKTIINDL